MSSGYLIADEFPAELAAGAAYVAGHDEQGRPVMVSSQKVSYFLGFPSTRAHSHVPAVPAKQKRICFSPTSSKHGVDRAFQVQ